MRIYIVTFRILDLGDSWLGILISQYIPTVSFDVQLKFLECTTSIAWEEGYQTIASDSQAAIKRCLNLADGTIQARSWIDEKAMTALRGLGGGVELTWVKGHSGVEGNELADRRAKDWVSKGRWESAPSRATPAGIRQAYPLYRREMHMKWNRVELRGLTYLHTDRGPMKGWLHTIGKAENPFCDCGETQNAAHLLASGCVGGKRRKWEDIWTDREFCAEVAMFLGKGGD